MPTPIEIIMDPISLIIIAMYIGLMIWESVFPARELPYSSGWKTRGLIAFAVYFFLSSYFPLLTDPFLENFRLLDLTPLGTLGGALVGVLVYELGLYLWHRSMHRSDFLWRTFHQMHHSAERLDTYGAFFFSPMDMIGFTLLGSIVFALLIGITPQAITVVLLFTNFLAIFQHANIKTPQWLGYIVQRPEAHAYHHAKGIHRNNYSDLSIFDMLFGTFYNPREFENETGFYEGASSKISEMLLFKDISQPVNPIPTNSKRPKHEHPETV